MLLKVYLSSLLTLVLLLSSSMSAQETVKTNPQNIHERQRWWQGESQGWEGNFRKRKEEETVKFQEQHLPSFALLLQTFIVREKNFVAKLTTEINVCEESFSWVFLPLNDNEWYAYGLKEKDTPSERKCSKRKGKSFQGAVVCEERWKFFLFEMRGERMKGEK